MVLKSVRTSRYTEITGNVVGRIDLPCGALSRAVSAAHRGKTGQGIKRLSAQSVQTKYQLWKSNKRE